MIEIILLTVSDHIIKPLKSSVEGNIDINNKTKWRHHPSHEIDITNLHVAVVVVVDVAVVDDVVIAVVNIEEIKNLLNR